ncbi:MAG: hypothetical protein AM326_04275 [Candidatus Thorarchaeota archaeon SMTZ-45]|nr:MAG: hypothetical protein AM326_04275 [Candidatus Thorarchaeota archaeon SMTZ-45]KXH74515.1 MAG: hypothetical protein AM325_05935 [Candidatus Thorarchaeota archaeon SMTZ1-45]
MSKLNSPSTFSIVARDSVTGDLGIIVQSKFPAVGSVVPWAKANIGAIATQAWANVGYGPNGLDLLESGMNASETLKTLLDSDEGREHRQIGIVDSKGNAVAYTGEECMEWAGHIVGSEFTCQGNILASEAVVTDMAEAYEITDGDLIDKLFAGLIAGQAAGGDRRGMQSAAIFVVRENGGYEGGNDRYVDVRVDEHPSPIDELIRIFNIYDMTLLSREDPNLLVKIEGDLLAIIQDALVTLGHLEDSHENLFGKRTQSALTEWINTNNFENKARDDGTIWPSVVDYLLEDADLLTEWLKRKNES